MLTVPCVSPQNHQGVCPQESVYCENKCGARMMRRLLSQHSMAECPKRTQPCKYCGKEFVYDTIQVGFPSQAFPPAKAPPYLAYLIIFWHDGTRQAATSSFLRN